MPSEAEIFAAVHGPAQQDPSVPHIAGAVVDAQRWRYLKQRAEEARQCYRPIFFPPGRAIQSPPPRPPSVPVCPVCAVVMVTTPGSDTKCPICGRRPS